MSRANPGRVSALKALVGVEEGGRAEDLLAELSPKAGKDRALAWHLTLGTLRWRGNLDHGLQPHLRRPVGDLDAPVRAALRMGLFEAHLSRTPARAAVHQAVECTKVVGMRRASGMVNAVLRRASQLPLPTDPSHTLPPWLYARWASHERWIERIREPAVITIAGCPPRGTELEPAILEGRPVKDMWRLAASSGQVSELDGYDDGLFWVMDPAAARVADMVTEELGGSGRVLDACAAPGGKTFRMAASGLEVVAVDSSKSRIDRMIENLQRLNRQTEIRTHDWLSGPIEGCEPFDAVLVDAPCTALGVVRRHPEIIWRRQPGDAAAMSVSQRIILRNAANHVKRGGALIYAVCSTEPEEGIAVAEGLQGWSVSKTWSSVPPAGDEDGFQAFVLRRIED